MNTGSGYLIVSGLDIDVVYKNIKNLHIGVYPPMGRIRVAAPLALGEEQVRLAVIQRLPWIKREQERLLSAPRQSKREMITGESHYVWGVRRRLQVIEEAARALIEVDGRRLLMRVPEGTSTARRRELLDRWYREELHRAIPPLIDRWQTTLGVTVTRWSVRRMKTKWGSCNRETGNLWFNLELAKKHPDCLEYLVVHEMVHLIERNHTRRFTELMTNYLPLWQSRRDELNSAPLGYQDWGGEESP